MDHFSLQNLVALINEVGEQDDAADISVSMENVDTPFDDLGVDSLAFMSVVAQLEARYGIRLGFRDAQVATNPAELFALVSKRLATV